MITILIYTLAAEVLLAVAAHFRNSARAAALGLPECQ